MHIISCPEKEMEQKMSLTFSPIEKSGSESSWGKEERTNAIVCFMIVWSLSFSLVYFLVVDKLLFIGVSLFWEEST
jgi:hypothetical protein